MHLKEVDANLLVTLDALLVDASVTRAAEKLGRSASAISHALAKLREVFDDELFVRAGQRLVPTAKALELAPTVHVILAGMESLLRSSKPFDPSLSVRDFAAASSEASDLILVEPLRKRLQRLAPSVHVNWTPSHKDEDIDSLRNARSHFVIDIEGAPINAPDVRVAKLFDDTLATLGRPGHPFAKRKPKAATFAAADHVSVHALPTLERLDQALLPEGLSCKVASQVSSVLVGVLVILNSDSLLTLPASLAAVLQKQFGLVRISQPVPPLEFPLRIMWHSSYDRDECHQWVRGEFATIAQEIATTTAA
jgi:DNA-binding transcriptional LysR family regulator